MEAGANHFKIEHSHFTKMRFHLDWSMWTTSQTYLLLKSLRIETQIFLRLFVWSQINFSSPNNVSLHQIPDRPTMFLTLV